MKKKFFIITIVMMLFAVQGYAQRGYYRHHRHYYPSYYGYYYRPYFSTWDWYMYGGYRYMYYKNCYFNALLGCYIYDSLERPSKVKIEGLTFTRRNNRLKVKNGTEPVTYLDLYRRQTLRYTYQDGRTIDVSTGNGYATITFYDRNGNQVEYEL
ncbi:MAG: hypothetical protein J6C85_06570 [Alphaproteobacteria bacterium]|nr:hypothetical protein [Alphaproteobacteria bacterium]